jgi:hypothetical protein
MLRRYSKVPVLIIACSTDAASPSCVKYLYSFPAVVYSAFGCSDVPGTFEVYSTFVASAPKSLAYTATTESGGTILLTSSNGSPMPIRSRNQRVLYQSQSHLQRRKRLLGHKQRVQYTTYNKQERNGRWRHPRRWSVAISCGFLGLLLVV